MIKKLQALKAKKGFTLVELIVVIAIIGVLAAILVPTMMGMVTKSRVTSANQTAKGISDAVGQFLTDADTANDGMKKGANANTIFYFYVGSDGYWVAEADHTEAGTADSPNTVFKKPASWAFAVPDGVTESGTTGGVNKDTPKIKANQITKLAIELADRFPTMKEAGAVVYVNAGTPILTLYTADISVQTGAVSSAKTATAELYNAENVPTCATPEANKSYKAPEVFKWDEKTAGISADGMTVGTLPEIKLGEATSST